VPIRHDWHVKENYQVPLSGVALLIGVS